MMCIIDSRYISHKVSIVTNAHSAIHAQVCMNEVCALIVCVILFIKWAYPLMHIKQLKHKCALMKYVHSWFALYEW
jgi:hypothetical protein